MGGGVADRCSWPARLTAPHHVLAQTESWGHSATLGWDSGRYGNSAAQK